MLYEVITTDLQIQKEDLERYEASPSSDIIHLNTSKYVSLLELGITQKIIEMDGNTINISSEPHSTTIEFTSSYKESIKSRSVSNIEINGNEAQSFVKSPVALNHANILLVEDNFSNQQIIILYIKNEVFKIDVAFNGKEALDKFGKAKYDLILMDVQMPIMDGFKATQKIRELENRITSYNVCYTKLLRKLINQLPNNFIYKLLC